MCTQFCVHLFRILCCFYKTWSDIPVNLESKNNRIYILARVYYSTKSTPLYEISKLQVWHIGCWVSRCLNDKVIFSDSTQIGAIQLRVLKTLSHYISADNTSLPLNLNGPPVAMVKVQLPMQLFWLHNSGIPQLSANRSNIYFQTLPNLAPFN